MRVEAIKAKIRWRYELVRAKHALSAALLVIPFFFLVVALSPHAALAVACTGSIWLLIVVALWLGGTLGRGIFPGLLASLIPLLATHTSTRIGHVCIGNSCTSLCELFCTLGGLTAGLLLARLIRHHKRPWAVFAVGAVMVVTIGSTGCTCIGLGGVGGILLGLGGGALLTAVRSLKRPESDTG